MGYKELVTANGKNFEVGIYGSRVHQDILKSKQDESNLQQIGNEKRGAWK